MTTDNIQGLETLETWKKSKSFALKVYKEILPLLPREEKWNLDQQIHRSVSSVSENYDAREEFALYSSSYLKDSESLENQ